MYINGYICPILLITLVILNQMSHFGGMLIEYDFLKLGIYSFSQIDENLTYISSSQTPRIVGSSKGKKPN
jgi:hypothetical protein